MSDDTQLRLLGLGDGPLPKTRPVYRHIAQAIERGITAGTLALDFRLPAERELAEALNVSRTTVVSAYRDLEARGLVRGYVGRGTFVSAAPDASGAPFAWRGKVAAAAARTSDGAIRDLLRHAADPSVLSVAAGTPALEGFPIDAYRRSMEKALKRDVRLAWGHSPTEGLPVLRETIAHRFGGQPHNILVLAGAQQGLDLLARCLIDPGDPVIVDRPGYLGALHTFNAAGARVIGWDTAKHDLGELEDLITRYRPKLIYTNPTFQNPTGWTMPLKLRRQLLTLASRLRVPIIEDDTYRELFLNTPPPPSLHSMDTQSVVIHLNTFSKVLAPGLRLGWLNAAPPIIEQLALLKQRSDPHMPSLNQLIVADMIVDGSFDRHLSDIRTEHRRRRDAMLGALERHGAAGKLQWTVPDGGLYLWCRLAGRVRTAQVQSHAAAQSIAFVRGEAFYPDQAGEREMRICFTSVPPSQTDDVAKRIMHAVNAARHDLASPQQMVAIV
ncbi:MAG TPA: PLP-dependent aminotransferase family protein [Vicinamibacterales bacterium]|nr:PLP-dependent aminotransferase family protein [Vicinamibacterales bacterium]